MTYNIDDSLAVLLDRHGKRGLETGELILQDHKGLMWSLALAAVLGYQENLYAVFIADLDGLG